MQLRTLGDFLRWAEQSFITAKIVLGHGTDNAWDEAVALARPVLKIGVEADRSVLDRLLTPVERKQLIDLSHRRIYQRIPAAYLVQEAYFAGLKFYVDERVIIPRSPFAALILEAFQPWLGSGRLHRILDLCCGSACMAIACAHYLPEVQVDALDISTEALAVAAQNLVLHDCDARVRLLQSDLFEACRGQKYDIIMSNPPYVAEAEVQGLAPEYQCEPRLALASGVDGLQHVDRIIKEAKHYLTPEGLLIVEVGSQSTEILEARYPTLPFTWLDFEAGGEGVFLLAAGDQRWHF